MKQADLGDVALKTVCTSTILLSPDPLHCISTTSSDMTTPANKDKKPDDPKQAHGDIQMEHSSD
jgi:hypothetical protein